MGKVLVAIEDFQYRIGHQQRYGSGRHIGMSIVFFPVEHKGKVRLGMKRRLRRARDAHDVSTAAFGPAQRFHRLFHRAVEAVADDKRLFIHLDRLFHQQIRSVNQLVFKAGPDLTKHVFTVPEDCNAPTASDHIDLVERAG